MLPRRTLPLPRLLRALLRSRAIAATALVAFAAAAGPALATPLQVYGVWHAGDDACTWAAVRDLDEFDRENHWIVDRGDGRPSVNLVVLSFVEPYKLLHLANDAQTADGVPIGMTPEIVNYFRSRGIRVMLSLGGITYVGPWDDALAEDPGQLGRNAAALARRLGVGIEIDYEGSASASIAALQAFVDAYRAVIPYDATGADPAARLTVDLAAGDSWLIALAAKATADWLDPARPVLDYANAMVPSRQPSAADAEANWQEHVDGDPRMNPPVPPLAPCKLTGSLFLTGQHGVTAECDDFAASVHYATRDFVQGVAPDGAGVTPGMLGYMFWAAECPSTRYACTTPPDSCAGGLGAGAQFFDVPVPMPPLRQDGPLVGVPGGVQGGAPAFALLANAPNPFRDATVLRFALASPAHVEIALYDVAGREIARPVAGDFPAGLASLPWRATGPAGERLRPGTYFARMRVVTAAQHRFAAARPLTILE